MSHGKFGTAVNCMDGRVQTPVAEWLKKNYGVDFVDTVTEPGPDGLIAGEDAPVTASIKKRVLISVEKHGSKVIAVAGHHDCAGNPVERDDHIAHIKKSVELIRNWGLSVEVRGLWVNDSWAIEEIV